MKRELLLAPNHGEDGGIYHVISRVVWREFILGDEEREYFKGLIRRYAAFCGIEVLSYCIMSNHFHLLIKVPAKPSEQLQDEVFLKRLSLVYSKATVREVREQIEQIRAGAADGQYVDPEGTEAWVNQIKEMYTRRMWDMSAFMKMLKQQMTAWYNKRTGRRGTMWEGRFKSVLVEPGFATRVTAAYIDLNPVRAGMVQDPKDYRWCSYGEAVAGDKVARRGLLAVMQSREQGTKKRTFNQIKALEQYRVLLAEEGIESGYEEGDLPQLGQSQVSMKKRAKGFSADKVQSIVRKGGQLSWSQLLRCRTRYFSDGVAIGGKEFVDRFFDGLKERTGLYEKRSSGARKMRVTGNPLHSLRDLKVDVFGN